MARYQNAYRNELDDEDETVATQPTQETPEPEPQDAEEASFKKRYGDLRRHMQQITAQKDEELRRMKAQLEDATKKQIKFPKTEQEIAEWSARYPDVSQIIDTIAQKRAMEALEIGEKKMSHLQDLERRITREKAESELLKLHPDFPEIRADKAFHEWVALQPKWVQAALYENDTDAHAAARAIDLYKADTKKKPGRPAKDAAQSVSRSTSSAPSGDGKSRFSESQVAKMNDREYEKNEEAILEAMRSGNFVYDMTGAAR
jgi:uncharacterized protein YecA (UPF0149 family)